MLIVYSKNGETRSTYLFPMACETTPATTRNETIKNEDGDDITVTVDVPAVIEELDGQPLIDWLHARDRLPFASSDTYRVCGDASVPHGWPLDVWAAPFLADGTLPTGPYTPTPTEVRAAMPPLTRRQLLLGLLDNGITTAAVEGQIALIVDDTERAVAEIEWANASTYERTHALIVSVGAALGLTETQIDTMWEAAALL